MNSQLACLGEQLLEILNQLENELQNSIWYAANIETSNSDIALRKFQTSCLEEIGNFFVMKNLANQIEQFYSGVFFALEKKKINSIEVDTEDEKFRTIPLKGVILEIRAFDTTFFEIYSDKYNLMEKISKSYRVEIELSK